VEPASTAKHASIDGVRSDLTQVTLAVGVKAGATRSSTVNAVVDLRRPI